MSPDLAGDTIYEEKLLLATSATSELARKVPSGPREFDSVDFALLDNEPFITIKRGQKFHLLFQDLCRRCSIAPRVVLESESPTAALMLTSAGIGSCFVTETLPRSRYAFLKSVRSCRPGRSLPPIAKTPISPARPER